MGTDPLRIRNATFETNAASDSIPIQSPASAFEAAAFEGTAFEGTAFEGTAFEGTAARKLHPFEPGVDDSAADDSVSDRCASGIVPQSTVAQLRQAREILTREAEAITSLASTLDDRFCDAVDAVLDCRGRLLITGMGKAGHIGNKLAATFSSTGTPAHALHPAEAVHGDLGAVQPGDVVLCLSNSGETEEVTRLLPILQRNGATLLAITASCTSTLGRHAQVTLEIGRLTEADSNRLAPSTSTTAMLALGDALALVASERRGFTPQQFAVYHPGGSLGRKLSRVTDLMRPRDGLRIALESSTVREVFASIALPGRRTGAVLLVDAEDRLTGLFTDSDLARLLESRREDQLDGTITEVMTTDPLVVQDSAMLSEVIDTLRDRKVSELPVVDADGRPVGLVDITDVIALLPVDDA